MFQATHLCKSCGSSVRPKTFTPGSFFIEVILWFAFIIPGLIYSIWRLVSRYKICPVCKSNSVIPLNTPQAQSILKKKSKPIKKAIVPDTIDIPKQIEKLDDLRKKGIISQEEFEKKKCDLLAKM